MDLVRPLTLASFAVPILLIGAAGGAAAGDLAPGDILACDPAFGDRGALVVVDPISGDREILSDLGDPMQGPLGERPWDVVRDSAGSIILLDQGAFQGVPAVFRVDPAAGQRTLLSDLSDGSQGPTGPTPWAIASTAGGHFLVTTSETHLLLAIDPETGDRTIVSDFTDPSQGVPGSPTGVVEEPAGTYLVAASLDSGTSALLRVDDVTGDRSVVSDFGEPGPAVSGLTGLALDSQGQALVHLASSQFCDSELYRVDPGDGAQELVATLAIHASDVAVEADGQLLAAGYHGGFCGPPGFTRLYRVDPTSGDVTFLAEDVRSGLAVEGPESIFSDGFESGDTTAWSSTMP